ncbi:Rubredoxin [Fulvivirga imtechensis AK7]|uniref:Rubredoxin n=1 Tax=Fulvivirga imtechensis AK7 TaxID=1237149 RepID=L8JR56_9BACT|nr:rubredoxin domain-containing protein [Fulvivirga imtechensis]ELR69979.1 Rubredoxin [Fulvivirga imtechensis AK7]
MVKIKELVRVFVKGGIISPGDLLKTIELAERLGASCIHFGSRQDILFSVKESDQHLLNAAFEAINTSYEINTFEYQNIASSYAALDLLPSKKWLASHIYHYVLDSFDYLPSLRINIVDPSQSLVPLFTGNINFLASNQENFWYLYLRFSENQAKPWQFPFLIYSEDIAKASQAVEEMEIVKNKLTWQQVQEKLTSGLDLNTQPVKEQLVYPDTNFPYYEGINRMTDDKYWLGLYWRNNQFNIDILKAICERCLNTGVGKLSLTPWKSFVIKGIFEKHRVGWEKLMGKFGMNLRHSALELNWHLPALDQEALELKNHLVRTLDQQDISTYGLTFTIKTTDDITLFTSIVIEKNHLKPDTYNILYSRDFDPNSMEYSCYAQGVVKDVIAPLLIELSHLYYEHLEEDVSITATPAEREKQIQGSAYQCKNCLTVYDEKYGDTQAGVAAGTSFAALPEDYRCSLCGGGKELYEKIG